MSAVNRKLTSWENARQQIGPILAALNKNPELMMAAAANPLLALRELGYEIEEGLEREFEDRIRFGRQNVAKIAELREEIFNRAGRRFDLDSATALADVLSSLLKAEKYPTFTPAAVAALPFTFRPDRPDDPLEELRNAHPVMAPLLDYRRMQASTPRLAPKELYDEIREKKRSHPVTRLVARLKSNG